MTLDHAMDQSPLHKPQVHESGHLHASGAARYVDDLPAPPGLLFGWIATSPVARGRITGRSGDLARAEPGVVAVLFASDIPGHSRIGPIIHDEPVLAEDEVFYCGQPVALVLAESLHAARRGAERVQVEIEPLAAILSIEEAIAQGAFHTEPHTIARGELAGAMAAAAVRLEGEAQSGAQDHFYLETQAAQATPGEGDASLATVLIQSSTQHPTEIQRMVAEVLGIGEHRVVCEVPRLGGGFGGKESQASPYACLAALGAYATGRPVRVWLNRDEDMRQTGKRHPFWSRWRAGFDEEGRLLALEVDIYSDGGFSIDLSPAVLDRALFHLDNAYFLPNVRFTGRVCRTNLPSNTAFRGFGGPQGMVVIEDVLNVAAETLGLDPADIRRRNLYGEAPRDSTHYGQVVANNRLPRITEELLKSADYSARLDAIRAFNASSPHIKRGIGFQPVKFGISFTNALLNQAGALLLIYADGTVQLNHGGTEMGQGLHTKVIAVCAHELGVPTTSIRAMTTSTDKVPNTSATAASSGTDLNGQAVRLACVELRERMTPVAASLLGLPPERASSLSFAHGRVGLADAPERSISFAEVAKACWLRRVSLSATGFYATPGIQYDPKAGRGTPFFYFAFGAAVAEVEVDGATGEHRLLRADILHDVGNSLVPTIDRGQVEGAFIQGVGWLTCEEVLFDTRGRPLTTGPSTYKIPAIGDAPADFRVELLQDAEQPGVVGGSKAVGEPPLMLALAVPTALRQAIAAFGPPLRRIPLTLPATPEAILRAVVATKGGATL